MLLSNRPRTHQDLQQRQHSWTCSTLKIPYWIWCMFKRPTSFCKSVWQILSCRIHNKRQNSFWTTLNHLAPVFSEWMHTVWKQPSPFFSALTFFLASLLPAGGLLPAGAGAAAAAGADGSGTEGLEARWMLESAEGMATSITAHTQTWVCSISQSLD